MQRQKRQQANLKSPQKSTRRKLTTHPRSKLLQPELPKRQLSKSKRSTRQFSSNIDKDSLDPNIAYSFQGQNSEQGTKRWYRDIDISPEPDGKWAILLNGRYARTHRNNRFVVPTKAYALACALEFENQTTFMIPHTMPLTEIAKIAIDRTQEEREDLTENIMAIFNCDSAVLRGDAEVYPALNRAQAKVFDPLITWCEKEFGVKVDVTDDFWGGDQPEETQRKIHAHIDSLTPYQFIVLDNITALGKSTIVGLNFLHNNINIEQCVRASLMEEYYQIKVSGNQVGDTYGTWLLDANSRQRVASHRQAMVLLDYQMDESSNWKM